jgi:hypothetical protein
VDPRDIRIVDAALVVWVAAWLVAAVVVFAAIRDRLPFVSGNPGAAVERTAEDLDRFAVGVRQTAADARTTGRDAQDAARMLAIVLGLEIALVPTLPIVAFYVLFRPLVAQQLQTR